ncbi:MAG TPA: MoaD/ThiS family protein [Candidatus Acidoferrum sp.]|nr:MoaD/ThiS family protein [Candidatus Acidoferrum sp.]
MIRVVLPAHLKSLARTADEVQIELDGNVCVSSVLSAIEARYPMLLGTIRDRTTHKRRPHIRYFACERDLSHDSPDAPLPEAVARGAEPLLIVGAMSGG